MSSFETALRVAIIGQEILIAAVLLFGRGGAVARLSGALFLLSVSAYLIVSDPLLSEAAAFLSPLLTLLAIIVLLCLIGSAVRTRERGVATVLFGFAGIFAVMLIGGLVVLGLVSIPRLGLDLFPRVEFPLVTVTTRAASATSSAGINSCVSTKWPR